MNKPLLTRCREAAGSWPAAVLLYRIIYWQPYLKVKRGHHKWLVRTGNELAKECALTPKEYKNAIRHLKEANLVAVEKHLFNGLAQSFIRLTENGEEVRKAPKGITGGAPGGPTGSSPPVPTHNIKILHIDTTGVNYVYSAPEKSGVNETEKIDTEEEKMDMKEILLHGVTKKKTPDAKKTRQQLTEAAWKQAIVATGKFCPELTLKARGQLKMVMKACPQDKAPEVVKTLVKYWGEFAAAAKQAKGLKNVPLDPDIGFVLFNMGNALDFWKEKTELVGTKGLVSAPKSGIVKKASVKLISQEEKATPEELQKILNGDD